MFCLESARGICACCVPDDMQEFGTSPSAGHLGFAPATARSSLAEPGLGRLPGRRRRGGGGGGGAASLRNGCGKHWWKYPLCSGFGRRVGAGAIGWAHLFEPFQSCPLPFIAAEVARAFKFSQFGAGKDVHLARARELATAWRAWSETDNGEVNTVTSTTALNTACRLLRAWTHLDSLAEVNASKTFSSLLGCFWKRDSKSESNRAGRLISGNQGQFSDFWTALADELSMTPTLQMPWGNGGAPYILAKAAA